jgi:hypothetical protein
LAVTLGAEFRQFSEADARRLADGLRHMGKIEAK